MLCVYHDLIGRECAGSVCPTNSRRDLVFKMLSLDRPGCLLSTLRSLLFASSDRSVGCAEDE